MTCISSVEVKKTWSCSFIHPFSFMAYAGTVLPLLLRTVLYCFVTEPFYVEKGYQITNSSRPILKFKTDIYRYNLAEFRQEWWLCVD